MILRGHYGKKMTLYEELKERGLIAQIEIDGPVILTLAPCSGGEFHGLI